MKRYVKGLFAATFIFGSFAWGPSVSFAADPAGWQLIDYDDIGTGTVGYLNGAEGGSAKICLTDAFGGAQVTIYDDDGSSRPLIKDMSFFSNGECYSFDVDRYVDGADNDAEFVVTTSRDITGTIRFELWD